MSNWKLMTTFQDVLL